MNTTKQKTLFRITPVAVILAFGMLMPLIGSAFGLAAAILLGLSLGMNVEETPA